MTDVGAALSPSTPRLGSILEELDIGHVVLIDDGPAVTPLDVLLTVCASEPGSNRVREILASFEGVVPDDTEILQSRIRDILESGNEIARAIQNDVTLAAMVAAPGEALHDLKAMLAAQASPVVVDGYLPDEWTARRAELLHDAAASEKSWLLLFDKSFEENGQRTERGSVMAVDLSAESPTNVLIAVLSYDVLEGTVDERRQSASLATAPRGIDGLSKRQLRDQPDEFAQTVGQAIVDQRLKAATAPLKVAWDQAHAIAAQSWADQDHGYKLLASAIELAARDGASNWETLRRVFAIKWVSAVEQQLHVTQGLASALAVASRDCPEPFRVKAPEGELKSLAIAERFIDAETLQRENAPISIGDIFVPTDGTGGGTHWVLLAPPCDLAIRSDGKRRLEHAWLVPMTKLSSAKAEKNQNTADLYTAPTLRGFYFPAVGGEAWSSVRLDLIGMKIVPLWALDLVSFDASGAAKWKETTNPPSVTAAYHGAKKLAQAVHDRSSGVNQLLKTSSTHSNALLAEIFTPPMAATLITTDNGIEGFDVGLRRHGRLREPFASGLLWRLTVYLGRESLELPVSSILS